MDNSYLGIYASLSSTLPEHTMDAGSVIRNHSFLVKSLRAAMVGCPRASVIERLKNFNRNDQR